MPAYLYILHPLREEFFQQPTQAEQESLQAQAAYLAGAASQGFLVLAGPCLDDTFHLVIFQAEDEQAAQRFMYNDPAVQANVMMAELHPLRIDLPVK